MPKWSIGLNGQDDLIKAFNSYDRAKPAMITKALRAGCTPLRDQVKTNVKLVTDNKGKTTLRSNIEAYVSGRKALNLDIFQKIRDEHAERWEKRISILENTAGVTRKEIDNARKKLLQSAKKFEDRALIGKAWRKFKKLPGVTMMEIGKTGMLYKSIDIKYLRPPVAAYHHKTGELMGYKGMKGRQYNYSRQDWDLAKWRPLKGASRTAYVGPRRMVVVAYNPFTRELVKSDPARYAHLVEKGHLIKIRGQLRGRTKPRSFIGSASDMMRNQVLSEMRRILRDEITRNLGSGGVS